MSPIQRCLIALCSLFLILAATLPAYDWQELPRRTAEFYDADGGHGIPLHVDEPAGVDRSGFPVSGGIPFPQGALISSENVRVLNPAKQEIPCQAKVLSRWLDGSVRWLLVDFQADVAAGGKTTCFLEYGPNVRRSAPKTMVTVTETAGNLMVDTGVLKFRVARGHGSLMEEAWLDSNRDGRYADTERVVAEPADVFLDLKDLGREASVNKSASAPVEPGEIGVWRFRTDPQNIGVKESWFAESATETDWKHMLTGYYEDRGYADYDGYSWYRAAFVVPETVKDKEVRLAFGAIDDFGWVYLNGRLAGHNFQDIETGGKSQWNVPLYVPIGSLVRPGLRNMLAVRVYDPANGGGIWQKVFVEVREGEKWVRVPIVCEPIPEPVSAQDAPAANLAVNGDFETVATNTNGPPSGWRHIVNTDPKVEGQGTIRGVILPDAPKGPRVMEIDKTDELGYFPALVFENIPVASDATYELSAWVKSEKPFYAGVSFAGPETKVAAQRVCVDGERQYPAAPIFRQIKLQYRTNPDVIKAGIVFRYQNQSGKLWVDGVTFQRIMMENLSDNYSIALDKDAKVEVETNGPLRAVIKVSGWYRSKRGFPFGMYILRVHAFAGQGAVRVFHTFINTGDPRRFFVKAMGVTMPLDLSRQHTAAFGTPAGAFDVPIVPDHKYVLFQTSDAVKKWPKFDQWQPHFRVLDIHRSGPTELRTGELAEGWADLSDGDRGCTTLIHNMWQQYPKAIEVEGARLTAWLWPEQAGPLDLRLTIQKMPDDFREFLKTEEGIFWYNDPPDVLRNKKIDWIDTAVGMAKTHELVFDFHSRSAAPAARATALAFEKPSLVFVTPAWYADSLALGRFHPYDPQNFAAVEKKLETVVDWIIKHQTEWFHWYGMLDYGCFQYAYNPKEDRWCNYTIKTGWQNGEVEQDHAVFLQYLRTGNRKYYDLAEAMGRHRMDVESIHYLPDQPPEKWGGGGRHHTDHWGQRMQGWAHTYPFSLRDYYWIAGYDRALDVLREYARAQAPLSPNQFSFSRDIWHSFKIPFAAWEVTGEATYKTKMDRALACVMSALNLRLDPNGAVVHVRGGEQLENWMFNEYLCTALNAYYNLTGDAAFKERYLAMVEFLFGRANDMYSSERYALAYFISKNPAFAKAAAAVLANYAQLPTKGGEIQRGSFTDTYQLANHFSATAYLMAAVYDARITPPPLLTEGRPQQDSTRVVKPQEGYTFTPVDLRTVVNAAPLAEDPFGLREGVQSNRPEPNLILKPGDIGFDFGFQGEVAAGFLPVTGAHIYPTNRRQPFLKGNFSGYPFGSVVELGGIPFDLPSARETSDKAIIILRKGEKIQIPVGRTARVIHFLGHICGRTTARSEEGAKYEIHFSDGAIQSVPLRNMVHYQPSALPVQFCTEATPLWRANGWDSVGMPLNVLSIEVPEKEIATIDVVETGPDHRFALAGITLEVKEKPVPSPAYDTTFAFKTIYRFEEGKDCGWLSTNNLSLTPDKFIDGHGAATFACRLPNGSYDVTLEILGKNADDYLSVDLEGAPGLVFVKPLTGLRMTLATTVTDGRLDVALRARVGRVPNSYGHWLLKSVRVRSRTAAIPAAVASAAQEDIIYGWQPDTSWQSSRLMWTLRFLLEYSCTSEKDKLLGDCVAEPYDTGPDDITFNVDLPNGSYETDCYVVTRCGIAPIVLDCFAEGVLHAKAFVLNDTPTDSWGPTRKVPMKADVKDGQLNLRFVLAGPKSKSYCWGIQAIIVRRVAQ